MGVLVVIFRRKLRVVFHEIFVICFFVPHALTC